MFTRIVITHGHHDKITIPDGDVLIHAGDFSAHGSIDEQEAFDQFLGTLPHPHKIVIAGNHDWSLEGVEYPELWFQHATYLQDEAVTIEGIKFYGAPWQPEFFNWAFNLPRGEALREKWRLIPEDTDVLITHGPPYGILDRVESGDKVGCVDLMNAIERCKPKLHLFGHIHEQYGVKLRGETRFANASICDPAYKPSQECLVIDDL